MVEIIPKPVKKVPKWQNIVSYVPLALLIVAVLGFFILTNFEKRALSSLEDLEDGIAKVGTQQDKSREAGVLSDKKAISDFSILLAGRREASDFFTFLEENTHPKVWFSEIALNLDESQALIIGKTPNFQTLGQQLFIFQAKDLIKDINLSKLSISEEGETGFIIYLSFDPQIFQ